MSCTLVNLNYFLYVCKTVNKSEERQNENIGLATKTNFAGNEVM